MRFVAGIARGASLVTAVAVALPLLAGCTVVEEEPCERWLYDETQFLYDDADLVISGTITDRNWYETMFGYSRVVEVDQVFKGQGSLAGSTVHVATPGEFCNVTPTGNGELLDTEGVVYLFLNSRGEDEGWTTMGQYQGVLPFTEVLPFEVRDDKQTVA